jgi:ferric-dicitrate binding protein FerR (iron transport regulator)
MPTPEVFYLHIQGKQQGPYTIPQIDHLLNSGLIAEETLYWREGLEQWQPVTTLVPLRRKANPWRKRLIYLGLAIIALGLLQFFGSMVVVAWREINQHEYTALAAYWRARNIVRSGGLPDGAVVQFHGFSKAEVELQPPQGASVLLEGELTMSSGETRTVVWSVPLTFDAQNAEWNGGPAKEVTR